MTKKKPESPKTRQLQIDAKKPISKGELVTIDLPPHFPFQDAMCLKEHKELFENLFQGK